MVVVFVVDIVENMGRRIVDRNNSYVLGVGVGVGVEDNHHSHDYMLHRPFVGKDCGSLVRAGDKMRRIMVRKGEY